MTGNKELIRELKTVGYMIEIYCRKNHKNSKPKGKDLCNDCQELYEYAQKRLFSCKFGAGKPTCANCRIHCYKPAYREKIKKVMRFSGPRMIYTHPLLAVRHLVKQFKKAE